MTAVIYARYSSDNQREESIEGQIRECTAYAEKNGITVVRHYIDRAISAKTDNRPQFQQMIKDSERKLFDIVDESNPIIYRMLSELIRLCCHSTTISYEGSQLECIQVRIERERA